MKKLLGLSLSMAILALAVSPAFASSAVTSTTVVANTNVTYVAAVATMSTTPSTLETFEFIAQSPHADSTKSFGNGTGENFVANDTLIVTSDETHSVKFSITDLADQNAATADKAATKVTNFDQADAAAQENMYKFFLNPSNTSVTNDTIMAECDAIINSSAQIDAAKVADGLNNTGTELLRTENLIGIPCNYTATYQLGQATMNAGNMPADENPSATLSIVLF